MEGPRKMLVLITLKSRGASETAYVHGPEVLPAYNSENVKVLLVWC